MRNRTRDKMQDLALMQHGFRMYAPDKVALLARAAGFPNVEIDHRDLDAKMDSVLIVARS